jgi:hypothetical protein
MIKQHLLQNPYYLYSQDLYNNVCFPMNPEKQRTNVEVAGHAR